MLPIVYAGVMLASAYLSSQAQNEQASRENAIYQANARQLALQSERVIEKGKEDENIHRQKVSQMIGSQRVSMASAGIDVGTGTAMAIQQETAYMGAEDASRIRNNAYLESLGYKAQASNQLAAGANRVAGAQASGNLGLINAGISAYGAYSTETAPSNNYSSQGGGLSNLSAGRGLSVSRYAE